MGQYYYLISSLPYLKISDEQSLRPKEFLNTCEAWLSESDMCMVRGASINEPFMDQVSHEVLKNWKNFEVNLRNFLLQFRSRNLGVEIKQYIRMCKRFKVKL